MDILNQIVMSNNIQTVRIQITNSVEEIEDKSPQRTDLIKPMREAESKLSEAYLFSITLRNDLAMFKNAFHKLSHDFQLQSIEMEKLKQRNKELMDLL